MDLDEGTHRFDQSQITHPNVIPHGIRCEGLLNFLSWISFDFPDHFKRTLDALLKAAGEGCMELHTVAIEGKDVRDFRVSRIGFIRKDKWPREALSLLARHWDLLVGEHWGDT